MNDRKRSELMPLEIKLNVRESNTGKTKRLNARGKSRRRKSGNRSSNAKHY